MRGICVTWQSVHLNELLMDHNENLLFYFEKRSKISNIQKFHIFERYICSIFVFHSILMFFFPLNGLYRQLRQYVGRFPLSFTVSKIKLTERDQKVCFCCCFYFVVEWIVLRVFGSMLPNFLYHYAQFFLLKSYFNRLQVNIRSYVK